MSRTPLYFLLLIFLLPATTSLPVEKLYFSDVGELEILRCDLDGTNLEPLVTSGIVQTGYIAIDRVGGKMYWSDLGTDSWFRANLGGTDLEEILLSEFGTPSGCALDLTNQKL